MVGLRRTSVTRSNTGRIEKFKVHFANHRLFYQFNTLFHLKKTIFGTFIKNTSGNPVGLLYASTKSDIIWLKLHKLRYRGCIYPRKGDAIIIDSMDNLITSLPKNYVWQPCFNLISFVKTASIWLHILAKTMQTILCFNQIF